MKLLPQQSHLQWSSSHNNHTFSEAPPTTPSSSHNNHIFSEAPPTTITSSVKLLPQQSHLQWSSSHTNHIFSEAPPTPITSSVKLLPLQLSNKCWNIPISLQVKTSIRASVWSEICRDRVIEGQREREIQNPAEWNTLKNKQVVFILDSLVMSLKNNNNINFKQFWFVAVGKMVKAVQ